MPTTDALTACPKCGATDGVEWTETVRMLVSTDWAGVPQESQITDVVFRPKTARCQGCRARVVRYHRRTDNAND